MFFSEFQHPSTRIKGSYSNKLEGKRILLGITGSIAASQSSTIARELIRHGAIVKPVMTSDALRMIGKDLMWWATGEEPITTITGNLEHISVAGVMNKPVDLMLIAPATTNTVAKLAAGIADTPVTLIASSLLGKKIPIMVLCVGHEDLMNSPSVQTALKTIKKYGCILIEPQREEGKSKVPDLQDIIQEVMVTLGNTEFKKKHFIITTGPTREYLDDVRFISNPASGLTGIELSKEAQIRGAEVELVIGPTQLSSPRSIQRSNVISTQEMIDTVLNSLKKHPDAIVILSAALADFQPDEVKKGKIKSGSELILNLKPTAKLSDLVKKEFPTSTLVLYKAESGISSDELVKRAYTKLKNCNADLVVANDISKENAGFGKTTNNGFIVEKSGKSTPFSGSKTAISQMIIDTIRDL